MRVVDCNLELDATQLGGAGRAWLFAKVLRELIREELPLKVPVILRLSLHPQPSKSYILRDEPNERYQ